MSSKKITVFGSSAPKSDSPTYRSALELGRMLASVGYTILNGGYIGTMEAVSQGAAQEGGHVIGITCDEIEAWRPVKPNKWLQEEIRFPSVLERLSALINYCDGALALPGGVGTLAEVAVMWVQLQTKAIQARPFILIGTAWEKTFSQLYKTQNDHIPMQHRKYISFARDEVTAFQLLQELFKSSSV